MIAILAAITIVAYNGIQNRSQLALAQSDVSNIQKKVTLFQIENTTYPDSITDCPTPTSLNVCVVPSSGNSFSYQAIAGSAYVIAPAYEIKVSNGKQFVYASSLEKTSYNEFVQYTDLAPIIDQYGLVKYQIEFDIKSASTTNKNTVALYMQNGSGARYTFGANIPVTTSYVHQSITLTPVLADSSLTQSILAFYGTYGTGNICTVKNLRIQLGS